MSAVTGPSVSDAAEAGTELTEASGRAPRRSWPAVARAYLSLTKPRIVELLLVTTVPAMMLAAGGFPPLGLLVAVLVGGAMAAGSANAINCYLDRDIDQVMRRTARRPLPAHVIKPHQVLIFGLTLGVCSLAIMWVFTNVLATLLTLAAIAYYDLVYTAWLKRRTPHNTVLGGVSGSAPVVIGWAAVTGELSLTAWLLFAIVFLWQPPHFYALALRFKDDYARANVPMLPVVASTRRVTAENIVYGWLTVAVSLWLWWDAMGVLYGVVAVASGLLFMLEAHRLHARAKGDGPLQPMRLFHYSTMYLTVLFAGIAIDALITA